MNVWKENQIDCSFSSSIASEYPLTIEKGCSYNEEQPFSNITSALLIITLFLPIKQRLYKQNQ